MRRHKNVEDCLLVCGFTSQSRRMDMDILYGDVRNFEENTYMKKTKQVYFYFINSIHHKKFLTK